MILELKGKEGEKLSGMENQAETSWHEILEQGVTLRLESAGSADLSYRGAAGALTPSLLASLRAHKDFLCCTLRPGADYLPLSPAQKRIWLSCRASPDSPLYNMAFAVHFEGPLNVEALSQTVAELPQNHPVLRAAFPLIDGQPVQELAPAETQFPPLSLTDLSDLNPDEQSAEAEKHTVAAATRAFDIERGPLWEARLLRLAPERHTFLFNVHHLLGDRWSMRLLFQDISYRYAQHSGQEPLRAHMAAPSYIDFALWQQRWLQGDECDRQISYWKRHLYGIDALAALPLERHSTHAATRRGGSYSIQLSPQAAGKLKAQAREAKTTLFTLMLGAFNVLIRQCSGMDDVRVGAPVANRNRGATRRVIAMLADNILLRTNLAGAQSFREAVERTRETVEGAMQHQNVCFDQVTSETALAGAQPFEVYFSMLNVSDRVPFPALKVTTVQSNTGTAKIDLTVRVREDGDDLYVDFIYDADMIEAASVERIAVHYGRLLELMAVNPDTALVELPFDEALKVAPPAKVFPAAGRNAAAVGGDDAPRDELEKQLAEIWQELLQVPRVGIRDDFFSLGGHSLLAVKLLDSVEKATGKNLSLSIFFQTPTIEGQAALLRNDSALDWPSLVRLQPQGTRPPLFCIDGAVRYRALADQLAPDQPVYGLIPENPTDGQWYSFDKIGERARYYLHIIKKVQPEGPYHLAGLSFAGLVALMIAKQLRDAGDEVRLLALFDTYGPGYFTMPISRRIGLHLHALRQLDAQARAQYFRDRTMRLLKKGPPEAHANGHQTAKEEDVPEDEWQVDIFARELSPEEMRHLRAMVRRTRRDPSTARYEGNTVLFIARDKPMEFLQADPTLGWSDYAPHLKIHNVPGGHTSLIQEPHVSEIAALLRAELQKSPAHT